MSWRACQHHGNTLTESGERLWCRIPGCSELEGRLTSPCPEPAVVRIEDGETQLRLCMGHFRAVYQTQIPAETLILTPQEESTRAAVERVPADRENLRAIREFAVRCGAGSPPPRYN